MNLLFWIYMALAAALLYTCFCRLSFTDKNNTKRPVRMAFKSLAVASLACLFAPHWGYKPDVLIVLLLIGIVYVQYVTSHYWRNGPPRQFRKRGEA